MKKTDFILIGLVLVIILVGVLSTRGMKEEKEIQYPLTLAGKIGSNEITYDEYEEMVKNDDAFIVIIERTGCSYCQMYMPVFNKVAKDSNLDIYYIDSTTYNKSEYKKITDLELEIPAYCTTNNTKTSTAGSFPKPMTFIIKDGKTVSCALGYKSEDNLKSFLFSYGVINQI